MRKTERFLISGILSVVALCGVLAATLMADPVDPANVAITCLRDTGSSAAITDVTYYQGNTLSLSNSVMYTGSTTNSAVQDLGGCTITIVAGQPGVTNNTTAVGYAIVEADGTWGASFVIPAYNPTYIEVTVSNTAVFTYPRYRINTQEQLPTP